MKQYKNSTKSTKNGLIYSNMKKIILIITTATALFLASCSNTKYAIASPPESYIPTTPTTDRELILEWQRSLIKIKEWQTWYNIQVGSNYFYTNSSRLLD